MSISNSDLAKIRELVRTEEYTKSKFIEEHRYYGNWEGDCMSCKKYMSDDDEVLAIDRKDLTGREDGALVFCRSCYKKLVNSFFTS